MTPRSMFYDGGKGALSVFGDGCLRMARRNAWFKAMKGVATGFLRMAQLFTCFSFAMRCN